MPDWSYAPPLDPWLVVLHADRDLVAIDKPSGLLSVPGRGPELADSAAARVLRDHPFAFAAHRLDLDTSGVLVFALRRKAEAELQRQFRERLVSKIYVARVAGHPAADAGVVALPLAQEQGSPPRSRVDPGGRPARTAWRVLSRDAGSSLVELRPETGRPHQIRLHLLAIGHPILGDRFYAPPEVVARADRLMLHASELTILHPYRQEPLTFRAPVPF